MRGLHGIGLSRLQGHAFEAKIGFQSLQLVSKKPSQMVGCARRQAGADRYLLHVTIHAEGAQRDRPRSLTGGGQLAAERLQQGIERPVDGKAGNDRL